MRQLLKDIIQGKDKVNHYSLQNGLQQYKGQIYLGPTCNLKSKVLRHIHNSPIGGHSGYLKSYHRLKQDFFCEGMSADSKRHIRECEVCQQNEVRNLVASWSSATSTHS